MPRYRCELEDGNVVEIDLDEAPLQAGHVHVKVQGHMVAVLRTTKVTPVEAEAGEPVEGDGAADLEQEGDGTPEPEAEVIPVRRGKK